MERAGFGQDWLPVSVQRRMAVEDQAEQREARRAEREREATREAAVERGLLAYRSAAEGRGEIVSAMDLAMGSVGGRTAQDVFADSIAAGDREDGRAAALERRNGGDVVYLDSEPWIGVQRSGWPGSEYELDRELRRAQELHQDLNAVRARRDYRGAEVAARARSAGR